MKLNFDRSSDRDMRYLRKMIEDFILFHCSGRRVHAIEVFYAAVDGWGILIDLHEISAVLDYMSRRYPDHCRWVATDSAGRAIYQID